MKLAYVSLIVSNEECIDFYKKLGFKEQNRIYRPNAHDEVIFISNESIGLKIYKDSTHPKRNRNPESLGLRYLCFEVDSLNQFENVDIKEDNEGKFIFLVDLDGQPIQIREKK